MASETTMTVAAATERTAGRSSLGYLPWTIAAVGGSLIVLGANLILAKYRPNAAVTQCLPALDLMWGLVAGFLLLAGIGRVRVLMGRELATYFQSPLAYIMAALYFLVVSFFMAVYSEGFKYVTQTAWVNLMVDFTAFLMVFVAPIIAMRLLAEEKSSGAMEILVTDPVTDWDIVLGKFLAAVFCVAGMLLPLGLYVVLFAFMRKESDPALEWGVMASGAIGLICLVALYTSIGLLASSLTKNQVISALIGVVALLIVYVAGAVLPQLLGQIGWDAGPRLQVIAESVSIPNRLQSLVSGQLELKSVFFFLSSTALVLYFTVRAVESRKWR